MKKMYLFYFHNVLFNRYIESILDPKLHLFDFPVNNIVRLTDLI